MTGNGSTHDGSLSTLRESIRSIMKEAWLDVTGIKLEQGSEVDFYVLVSRFEKQLIEYALDITDGNQNRAAKLLRLKPNTLNMMIQRHKLGIARRNVATKKPRQ